MNEEENLEEGLEDPYEKELREAQEQANQRNEEGFKDLTEGKIRRKRTGQDDEQLELPLESRNPVRVGAGLAFEVGANSILDFFSLVPGSQAAGSAVINAIAQGIRGGKFSFGEVLGSAAASQIPGLAQGKAITTAGKFTKAAATGAVSGGIEATSIAAVDRGELPTIQELGLAIGAGGILGAGFQKVGDELDPKIRGLFQDLKARANGDMSPFEFAGGTVGAAKVKKLQPGLFIDPIDGDEFGTYLSDTEVFKTIRRWRNYRPPAAEVNKVRRTLLKFGMVGNRFDMNIYKAAVKRDPVTKTKRFTANEERDLISIFVTAPITKVNYNKVSKRVMPQFRKQYGPMLKALGLNPSELQLHHLLPLKASLPLYHGLVYDSDEWWELTAFLLKRHIKAGDSETNLRKLIGAGKRSVQDETAPLANKERPLKTPHSISHQHVRDEFGEDGSKFFTQDVLDSIYDNQTERIRIADLYTKRMRRNFDLTNQAQKVYEMTFDPKNKYAMEDIVSTMSRMDQDGYFDLTDKKYQVDILNDMIRGIEEAGGGNQYLRNRDIITEKEYNLRQASLKEQRESFNQSIDYAQEYAADVAERAKKRENIFTRYSTLEDAIDAAEELLEKDRLFYSDPALPGIQNYEQTVLRLARLLMENPNYIP
jgi:hypothetical protein|tara:strand:- start:44 stop:1999 length:1956 start_codon:yes stop_codon:yes gene_type:complete